MKVGGSMREIGIGLLGFGTVGAGVVKMLQSNGDLIAERLGVRPVLRRIADLDLESDRGVTVDRAMLTTDAEALIASDDVDVVVELIGGTTVARDLILRALRLGKPVVTANKHLLADHGEEIFAVAAEKKTDIYFGASVGGGIPIIRALREGLIGNHIESIRAILNGTCNYILTRMEADQMPFADALDEAQAMGFAEADPTLDVDGLDTAHKAVILASLAHGFHVPMDKVHVEGIRGVSEVDISDALDLGYRIKLLAVIRRLGEDAHEVEVRVHPALVPLDHMLASVSGVFNAVMVRGDFVEDTLYYGRGAGQEPTASTVIGDICDVIRNIVTGACGRVPSIARAESPVELKEIGDVVSRSYLRLTVEDRPGVLGRVATVLAERGISIASVLQPEQNAGEYVPVVIVTHEAREKDLSEALDMIDSMDFVGTATVRLRIEE